MSASPTTPASPSSSDVSPQQIGKAFVVQYYRLLHEHPESLHRFYSSASTLMHDDPTKTVTGTEAIAKRIEQLSFKQRHVKIRQVDCHSTVGSAVVVQVCGEISSTMNDPNTMKRFVQTFVLAPTEQAKQKYYVHNDIFRYQDTPIVAPSTPTEGKSPSTHPTEGFSTLTVPTSKIEFADNSISEKKEEKSPSAAGTHMTPPVTPVDTQEKEATSKPKSYRDAIGKTEKPTAAAATSATATESQPAAAVAATGNTNNNKSKKANKQQQQQQQQQQPQPKTNKAAGNPNNRSTRGHPQDVNEYCDDSWYYSTAEEGYLSTGYTDDQEVFVGHLSAQVTENEVRFPFFFFFINRCVRL